MSVLSRIQWHDKPVGGIAHYLSGARARFTIWATSGEQSTLPDGESPVMMADLRTGGIEGPVLLFCGFWGEREELDRLMAGRDVLLGYPVAGGRITR